MRYKGIVIRPPSEARSYILQVTYGCSHNACTFCPTYKGVRFSPRRLDEVVQDINEACLAFPWTRRVFLADGNALCLPTDRLSFILERLRTAFPRLERVGIYSNAADILGKSEEELKELRRLGLGIVYLGLESGDDRVLERVKKGSTAEEMVEAVLKAKECGLLTSVIVLLGLGGVDGSIDHAVKSAEAVSRMNPHYLSALTLMLVPGTPLYRDWEEGRFHMPDQEGLLRELRAFLGNCRLDGCVFRTNHASNYLPLAGTLNRDRERLIETIDRALSDPSMLRPEYMRGL
ncbi:MAG: radical SAM protein [Candidatus Geothermincolales bacterium]